MKNAERTNGICRFAGGMGEGKREILFFKSGGSEDRCLLSQP